jgi:hypothetical protein
MEIGVFDYILIQPELWGCAALMLVAQNESGRSGPRWP